MRIAATLYLLILIGCTSTQQEKNTSLQANDFLSSISEDQLRRHVEIIAADSMEGRGFGTSGFERAAQYVASLYQRIGLSTASGGDQLQDYFQPLSERIGDQDVQSKNVVGYLEGSGDLKNEAIIVIAHLDHLGMDTTLTGDIIYNGAADDASGVAACLLLAETLAQAQKQGAVFDRSIIFLNTTGEERQGRAGSRFYIQQKPIIPIDQTMVAINMDGVAGLDTTNQPGNDNYVYIVSEDTTSIDLKNLNTRLNQETGINLDLLDPPFAFGSDQKVFEGYLVPSIYYSTGLTSNYHKVSDHPETLNYEHSQKIIQLAFSMIWELANDPNPTPSFNRKNYQMIADQFKCRPCGCKLDSATFHQPGTCPDCNMALIPKWEKYD